MSLRFKISLFISISTLFALILSMILIVINARHAVEEEMRSTAHLTLDFLEIMVSNLPQKSEYYQFIIQNLKNIEKRRHLTIHFEPTPDIKTNKNNALPIIAPNVPVWFTNLVAPPVQTFRRTLATFPPTDIVLQTDPSDEIEEVWQESSVLLLLIIIFAISIITLLYIGLGIAFRPLNALQNALDAIKHCQYQTRLRSFRIQEFNKLAIEFNNMAEKLEIIQKENQRLLQYSLAVQEEERRVIARELHDELGQCLNAIKADAFYIMTDNQQPAIRDSARAIVETTSYIYDLVKDMIRRLRPAALDELGLVAALQQTLNDWQVRYPHIIVQFQTEGDFSELSVETQIHLYRIVQEGLTNVAKHAQASHLNICLTYCADKQLLKLDFSDDGIGFDIHASHTGFGLIGMRERIVALAGEFELESGIGKGTHIHIRLQK